MEVIKMRNFEQEIKNNKGVIEYEYVDIIRMVATAHNTRIRGMYKLNERKSITVDYTHIFHTTISVEDLEVFNHAEDLYIQLDANGVYEMRNHYAYHIGETNIVMSNGELNGYIYDAVIPFYLLWKQLKNYCKKNSIAEVTFFMFPKSDYVLIGAEDMLFLVITRDEKFYKGMQSIGSDLA